MKTKICTKCEKELPATSEYFAADKRIKCGFQSRCRECNRQCKRKHYEENKEIAAERNRKYREENREYFKQYDKKYYENNKTKRLEYGRKYSRKYREENKDRIAEYDKKYREENKERIAECSRQYYEENKERIAEYHREYYEENKEYFRQYGRKHREENKEYHRSRVQKRKSLKRNLPSTLTTNQWQHAQSYFNHSCAYCGSVTTLEQDHFWPLSRGGGYTATNIIPACRSCNCSKNNRPFEEWYPTHESYSPEREAKIYRYFEQLALENGEQGIQPIKQKNEVQGGNNE